MVAAVSGPLGGIIGLQRFVEDHAEAIEYDLIRVGLRLRDIGETLSWSELKAFIQKSPPTGESALFRELHPKSWWWTPDTDFLAMILFAVQVANWQRSGGRGSKPKMVSRPMDAKKGRNAPKTRDQLAERRRKLAEAQERNRRAVTGGD